MASQEAFRRGCRAGLGGRPETALCQGPESLLLTTAPATNHPEPTTPPPAPSGPGSHMGAVTSTKELPSPPNPSSLFAARARGPDLGESDTRRLGGRASTLEEDGRDLGVGRGKGLWCRLSSD